ncbi:uncharacterized protein OCT59_022392 [Rhizophagus irregularis]|uniref:uncharacterized protein n=1 Tax=Rhizophagus irregularis TaxID=588596 RepID=UPI001A0C290D|nr:hypothetical protein OCT59_022392 [Rhizophagus irregularis]GBC51152.2 hypothetical protein GLOIN_2v1787544 [Rhizophagus irregularis DAOM 181602=DAOM 197198]
MAFVAECKKNKKIQLCVYSAKQNKRKEIVYGSSVVKDNVEESVSKKLRTSESDSGSLLNTTKSEIYKNLPKCEYHIQGCLIAEDGRHFKLNNEMVIIWARAIIAKINRIDAIHSPLTKLFDRVNYRYPNSKRPLEDHNNNFSIDDSAIPVLLERTKPNLATTSLNIYFPMGPPEGKRFVIKSSLNIDEKAFLSEQMIEEVFFDPYIHLWIDIETTIIDFNDLFDDN